MQCLTRFNDVSPAQTRPPEPASTTARPNSADFHTIRATRHAAVIQQSASGRAAPHPPYWSGPSPERAQRQPPRRFRPVGGCTHSRSETRRVGRIEWVYWHSQCRAGRSRHRLQRGCVYLPYRSRCSRDQESGGLSTSTRSGCSARVRRQIAPMAPVVLLSMWNVAHERRWRPPEVQAS